MKITVGEAKSLGIWEEVSGIEGHSVWAIDEGMDETTEVEVTFERLKEIIETLSPKYSKDSTLYSGSDIDLAYLCGAYSAAGIDAIHKERQMLKKIGKDPHEIITLVRKTSPQKT